MIDEQRMAQIEDALGNLKARIEGIGTLQVAMAITAGDLLEAYEERLNRTLQAMRQLAAQEGRHAEAAVINRVVYQLQQELGLPAND